MDVAELRTGGMGDRSANGVLLLLAVADRDLLQTAQEPRPGVGAVAAGDRAGDCASTVGRGDGVCGGLATASGPVARGGGVEGDSGPSERPSDQAHAPAHGTGPSGWAVGLALDAGAA